MKYEPIKFIDRNNAFSFAARCLKSMWVMLGDDDRFWVVCPADASRLEKQGYEYAI
jgi:hypothetical protein